MGLVGNKSCVSDTKALMKEILKQCVVLKLMYDRGEIKANNRGGALLYYEIKYIKGIGVIMVEVYEHYMVEVHI